MTSDLIQAFIERHAAAWNRRDAAALSLGYAEDGVIASPMFARVEGRLAIRGTYASLFEVFPDWQIAFDTSIADGQRVAIAFSVTATHKGNFMGLEGTGRRCSFEGVSLLELGPELLIASERRFYDFTGLLAQLGVLRIRPAR
jgi:steroid delta-isomerase-like uncharacterized protein